MPLCITEYFFVFLNFFLFCWVSVRLVSCLVKCLGGCFVGCMCEFFVESIFGCLVACMSEYLHTYPCVSV